MVTPAYNHKDTVGKDCGSYLLALFLFSFFLIFLIKIFHDIIK